MTYIKYTCLLLLCLFSKLSISGIDVKTYVPKNAYLYLPVLKKELDIYMPNFKYKPYFAGLIEQESCITLVHSRCWKPTSELKTSREQGVGLGQITRAWNSSGSLRFDSLSDMKRKYRLDLKEANWDTIKNRPDLQIRIIVFMVRDLLNYYKHIPSDLERLAFADSAYNGGTKLLDKERTLCGLAKRCDPNLWFGHTEKQNSRGTRILYGSNTAWDINRHHVRTIFFKRALLENPLGKYNKYL